MPSDNQTLIPSYPLVAHAYERSPLLLPQLRSPKSFFTFASVVPWSRLHLLFQDIPLVDDFLEPIVSTPIHDHVTWILDLPLLLSPVCPTLDHRGRCHQFPRRQVSVQTSLRVTNCFWLDGPAQEQLDRRTHHRLKTIHSLLLIHGIRLLRKLCPLLAKADNTRYLPPRT